MALASFFRHKKLFWYYTSFLNKSFNYKLDSITVTGYCNGIELKLEDVGNASTLDMGMFGRYDLTSQIIDNREVYLSENHLYTIWYSDNVTSWILSRKNENTQIDIIYFNLDQNWDTYAKATFVSNAYGDHLWNVVGQSWLQINVSVICTSTMGKISIYSLCITNKTL